MSLENKKIDNKPIAVFDICDTLYYSNTTHDYIGFVAQRRFSLLKYLLYKVLNSSISPLRYFFIISAKFFGIDFHKKFNIRLLKGLSRKQLEEDANEFVTFFLFDKKITETHLMINKLLMQKIKIVLCSSSIEPVVKSIAKSLYVRDYVSTKLKFVGEVCLGKIQEEIAGNKILALQRKDFKPPFFCAVSDNYSDTLLLQKADDKIAVVHSNKSFIYWNGQSVKIIDLRK